MAGLRTTLIVLAASGGMAAGVASVGKTAPRPAQVTAANESVAVQQQPAPVTPTLSPAAPRAALPAAQPVTPVVRAALILPSPARKEPVAVQRAQRPLPTHAAPAHAAPAPTSASPAPSGRSHDDGNPAEPTRDVTTAPAPRPTTESPAPAVVPSPTPVWSHDDRNDDNAAGGGGSDD